MGVKLPEIGKDEGEALEAESESVPPEGGEERKDQSDMRIR